MDRGVFVIMNVGEEELKSVTAKKPLKLMKGKKLHKKCILGSMKLKEDLRPKNSSLPSTPTSSLAADSDTASVCSVSSICSISKEKFERKRKKQTNKRVKSKKLKTDNATECSALSNDTNTLLNASLIKDINSVDSPFLPLPVPDTWRAGNSTHYIFSSDEDCPVRKTETESTFKIKEKNFSPSKKFHSAGKRNSQLWCNGDWIDQKERNTYQNCGFQTGKRSSCLTDCNSCVAYLLPTVSEQDIKEMSCYLALDCEFVGVGPRKTSALGRCSIVDWQGEILFDQFVKPPEKITDYRTPWSGLRPRHIRHGIPFVAAQEKIAAIIKDKVVIGHAVHNDFRVMGVSHPLHLIRDTASCKLLREMANLSGNSCALRKLTSALLGRTIQKREHCSVTDARACLDLFRLVRTEWEPILLAKLKRRAAVNSEDNVEGLDNMKSPKLEPILNGFFDDAYWPDHIFKDI